jgi:RNA polymerase sigma-70 factor (ECF subfamily)
MRGDKHAFRQLFEHYYQPVFNNIYRVLKNRSLAEDILQDTFLALWEKRETIKNPENVSGWLFVTSTNKAINFIRREIQGKYKTRSLDSTPEMALTDDIDPFDFQMDVLKKAINTLSPQQIKVFELCKMKGKSYEEAAKEMGISKNTVKMHLIRANSSIRAYVERQSGEISLISCFLFALVISSR